MQRIKVGQRGLRAAGGEMGMGEVAAKLPAKLSAMLSVRGGAQAVAFYKAAFGAEELFCMADDGGAVVAQLAVGDRDFWVADESPAHQNFSPETLGGGSVRMMLVAEDPDGLFDRAVAAGATVVRAVTDEDYGWRVGRIVDPFGHHWEIGRPI